MTTQNIIFSLFVVIATVLLIKISDYIIKRTGERKKVIQKRIYYVSKFSHFIIYFLSLIAFAIVWNVQLGGITVLASSVFAVIGVALFAQWSILSNLTSSIIIFFTFPARVGDKIKIIDGDNSITGEIVEISLFHIEILNEQGNKILYPNNLFIQKPIMNIEKPLSPKKKKYI
jgi:small-conductance mechanosensitive channel